MALIGFGLDSVIEVSSAAAVAWQFVGVDPQRRERTALRIIGWSFFALAAYVAVEAVRALLGVGEAERSTIGIMLVTLSVVVMPFLSLAQRRAGQELGSASAVADSKQTLLCTYLSAAVLVGLVLNAALGWWWADPAARRSSPSWRYGRVAAPYAVTPVALPCTWRTSRPWVPRVRMTAGADAVRGAPPPAARVISRDPC